MKRIKRLSIIFITIFTFFVGYIKTDAATLSVSATASATTTVVGNTITLTVKYSSTKALGAIYYTLSYDSSYFTLTSGTQSNALSYTGTQKSDTLKFVLKAKKKGSSTIKFKINEALDFDFNVLSAGTISKTITIKTQAEIEASYSKNNNLSSLKISSGTLSPAFNKNTLEYSATVENNVNKITVSGSKEDSKSYVDGLKEYTLEEGNNKIQIKVTAQNGSSKTYIINVTRKELAPINVKTEEGLELKVVRKKELLSSPNDNYIDSKVTINDEEVPAFFNQSTNTYLVGLKDEEGNISLYTYKDNKYSIYKELSFNSIIITPIDTKNIPKGYIKTTIKINNMDVVAYKDKNNSNYYLISGINIHTGKENIYQYNKEEETIQKYNDSLKKEYNILNNKLNNYLYVIIGLGSILIITYLILLISSIKKNKSSNKNKKKTFDFGNDNKSILDIETIDEFKEEKKEDLENTDTLQENKKKKERKQRNREK